MKSEREKSFWKTRVSSQYDNKDVWITYILLKEKYFNFLLKVKKIEMNMNIKDNVERGSLARKNVFYLSKKAEYFL